MLHDYCFLYEVYLKLVLTLRQTRLVDYQSLLFTILVQLQKIICPVPIISIERFASPFKIRNNLTIRILPFNVPLHEAEMQYPGYCYAGCNLSVIFGHMDILSLEGFGIV